MSSLYIHIPFRRRGNAFSEEFYIVREEADTPFIAALGTEIEWYGQNYGSDEPVESIYVGGGEPSILFPSQLERICRQIDTAFDVRTDAEITLEAHPADLSSEFLRRIAVFGINRLSLGAESFFDDDLSRLQCRHTASEARRGLHLCAAAELQSFNVDLRFGLPDQPVEYWGANLERCVEAAAPHISTYRVDRLEDQTDSHDDTDADQSAATDAANEQYELSLDYLQGADYVGYELSHFAKPGHASRQLLAYWNRTNYIGFGPSAHSFWHSSDSSAHRWSNVNNVARYIALIRQRELPLETRDPLTDTALANEYILLRLQTREGLDLVTLKERYGVDLQIARETELSELTADNWIEWTDDRRVKLTTEGRFRHEAIASRLLISNEQVTTS